MKASSYNNNIVFALVTPDKIIAAQRERIASKKREKAMEEMEVET